MTNLINKVLDILGDISDIQTVLFDNSNSANVRIDRKPCPAALLYTLPDWKLDISHGTAKESAEIQVFFFNHIQFDATAENKLSVFESMGEIAREFIYRLLQDSTLRVLDDTINIKAAYGEFDSFVAGCVVNITLEEKQGSCLYLEPESEPTQEPTPEPNEDNTENQG